MEQSSKSIIEKFTYISRKIFSSCILFGFFFGAIVTLLQLLELKWRWLEIISLVILVIAVLLFIISWITPGILILLRTPWLAYAWLRGINTFVFGDTPWEDLSSIQKFPTYFWSILPLGVIVLAVGGFLFRYVR